MVGKQLFIEGAVEDKNGGLKEGFSFLLSQKLKNQMPRLVMGNSKLNTIDVFLNTRYRNRHKEETRLLLIDLDTQPTSEAITKDLLVHELTSSSNVVFYMVQEMEAWFLSQPQILDEHFKVEVSKRIPQKHPTLHSKPCEILQGALPSGKHYHKVRDAVSLLKKLELDQLMNDFTDVKNLVDELQKP
jgi:Domain of unknown function (DUF4276)